MNIFYLADVIPYTFLEFFVLLRKILITFLLTHELIFQRKTKVFYLWYLHELSVPVGTVTVI